MTVLFNFAVRRDASRRASLSATADA